MKYTEQLEIDGEAVEWEYRVMDGDDGSVTIYRKWLSPPEKANRRDVVTLPEGLLSKLAD